MMSPAHLTNLGVHVSAGAVALAIGFTILSQVKGTPKHRRLGRIYGYFTLIVCLSATIGNIFFRFLPIFATLTVLVLYQLASGWRVAHTRDKGPAKIDALWTFLAILALTFLFPIVLRGATGAKAVIYSTMGGLGAVLFYDTARWFFPRAWHATLWRYEHTYKLIATISGMLSALVGNVVRVGQPWSQVVPSALGMLVILYFFVRLSRRA
jgi:uncharacterized membrane protein